MSLFASDPTRRPSPGITVLGAFGAVMLIGLMAAIPALAGGAPALDALSGVFLVPRFWVATALPVAAFYVLYVQAFPLIWRHLVVSPGRPAGAWKRNLYFSSACGLFYVLIVARGIWVRVESGQTVPEALSEIILAVIAGVATVAMLIYAWLSPSEEKARAISSGDYSRMNDERNRLVAMRSAHSVLSAALIAFVTIGAAVDILTYHGYPVRSFIEAGALLAGWQVAYAYWDGRL